MTRKTQQENYNDQTNNKEVHMILLWVIILYMYVFTAAMPNIKYYFNFQTTTGTFLTFCQFNNFLTLLQSLRKWNKVIFV